MVVLMLRCLARVNGWEEGQHGNKGFKREKYWSKNPE